MLPDNAFMRVARKESTLFFASPVAFLFLGVFSAITLFVFFWSEAFFARNISDVRPLFQWMPILLIFLCSTLTMRIWSDERRAGTLEHVLTQPQPLWQFVFGKFIACVGLLFTALALTLALPITVSLLGDLDWGPVWAGYAASLLLGAVYLSLGLYVSSRSENAIVALIGSVLLGALLYLPGAPFLTGLFSHEVADWLRQIGTGSRFESIARGVIDFADLYYYLSLIAFFLVLNLYSLERGRWAETGDKQHHRGWSMATLLLAANLLVGNFWISQLTSLRWDVTQGRIYSLSDATHNQLAQLSEPLLIRGYFSAKTHPLLAPLVPQLTDLLEEYQVAGGQRVQVEIIDPTQYPEREEEANQRFGIRAVPFQVADRYQAALVNSYFNVLVQYGDEYQTLGFRELIEVQQRSETDVDVRLRNPEYDLTSAVRKVVQSYQSAGNLFDTVNGQLAFNGYISSDDKLPPQLIEFRSEMKQVLDEVELQSNGRFKVSIQEPEQEGGALARQLESDYGFRPMAQSLLSTNSFYFYLTLQQQDQVVQIPLGDLSQASFKRNLEAGIKRFASGFTKTVALVMPEGDRSMSPYGGGSSPGFYQLEDYLSAEHNVIAEDLADGQVSGEADVLLLASPRDLSQTELFAVDQFLMRGGTIIAATSPYQANLSRHGLSMEQRSSGLENWFDHMGLKLEQSLVLDPKNSAMPIPVTREIAGFRFQELRMIDYPYFVEARGNQLADHPITGQLPSVVMNWASPISVAATTEQSDRIITPLVYSSDAAWQSSSLSVAPRVDSQGVSRFSPQGDRGQQLMAVISQGRFDSWFNDRELPQMSAVASDSTDEQTQNSPLSQSLIERSPESARLILFSSSDFLRDDVLGLGATRTGAADLSTLELVANAVDWSVEDSGLLSIRSRSHFNRTLAPLPADQQRLWEYGNYILAGVMLLGVYLLQRFRSRARQRHYLNLLLTQEVQ